MADTYRQVAGAAPSGPQGDPFQRINVPAGAFGEGIGQGAQKLGDAATLLAKEFGQIAADDATNEYTERVNKLMNGEPGKMIKGPDGKEMPDVGFMGLKGRAALDAAPGVTAQMEALRKEM